MSLEYYAHFEDNLTLANFVRAMPSHVTRLDDRSFKHNETGLIIHLEKADKDDGHIEHTEKAFGFTPQIYVNVYFNKRSIAECEIVLIDLILHLFRQSAGDAILGFSQSDYAFLHRQSGQLRIDNRWTEIISKASFNIIKDSGLPNSVVTLPDM